MFPNEDLSRGILYPEACRKDNEGQYVLPLLSRCDRLIVRKDRDDHVL